MSSRALCKMEDISMYNLVLCTVTTLVLSLYIKSGSVSGEEGEV